MVDEVGPDRVVDAGFERQLELGPDAVCRSDKYRLGHIRKRTGEHPAKAADLGQCPFIESAAGVLAYLSHGLVRVVDRHARVGI